MAFNPNQQQPPLNWRNYQENVSFESGGNNQNNWFDNLSNLNMPQQGNNMQQQYQGQNYSYDQQQGGNRRNSHHQLEQTFTMPPPMQTVSNKNNNNRIETRAEGWDQWDDDWQEGNKNAKPLQPTFNNNNPLSPQQIMRGGGAQYNQTYVQTTIPTFNALAYSNIQSNVLPTSVAASPPLQTKAEQIQPSNNNNPHSVHATQATDYFNQNFINNPANTNPNQWNTIENNNFKFDNFDNTKLSNLQKTTSPISSNIVTEPIHHNIYDFSQPDNTINTPLNQPTVTRVIKTEVVSPQWSSESRPFSQTSSEKSSEIVDVKISNTITSSKIEQTMFEDVKAETKTIMSIENSPDDIDTAVNTLESNMISLSINNPDVTKDEDNSFLPLPPPPVIQSEPEIVSKVQTPPLPPPPFENQMSPPPKPTNVGSNNPYKRVGAIGHHQLGGMATPNVITFEQNSNISVNYMKTAIEPSDQFVANENTEKTPSNDRNEYLQIGHLSEDGYNTIRQDTTQSDQNDNLPPPGFSRLVLGQQEQEQQQKQQQQHEHSFPEVNIYSNNEPPPGLDRMIPGTDLETETNFNLGRLADGEVSDDQSNIRTSYMPPQQTTDPNLNDRNFYLVPGESNISSQQRFIPGVENDNQDNNNLISISDQQRELVMDGENLQDIPPNIENNRTLEGGNTVEDSIPVHQTEIDSIVTADNTRKEISNTSTCDDSDNKDRYGYTKNRPSSKRAEKNRSRDRYDSDDSDDYSDREKRHRDRDLKYNNGERRRDAEKPRRKEGSGKDAYYDERDRNRYEKERYRRPKADRYETDDSKYETERSSRYHDGDRKKYRDREDYYKKGEERIDRRYRRDDDRRKDDRSRDDRKRHPDYDDYEYRNRNDRMRERYSKSDRVNKDERDRKMPGPDFYGSYNYDPYMYYMQHQRYFEQLRRTNPQAYADWYRNYVAHMQRNPLTTTDGRESVHSGRSSANDNNDRYNRPIQHFYTHEDAQRQLLSQSQPSAMLDQSFLSETSSQVHSLYQPSMRRTPNLPHFGDISYQSEMGFYQQRTNVENISVNAEEKHRTTPCKFAISHPVSSLSCGILVTVKSRYSNNGYPDTVKLLNIGINDNVRKLFQSFPGPLEKAVTHKKTIIEFCEEQLKIGPPSMHNFYAQVKSRGNSVTSLNSSDHHNRGSFTLLWNYLILLLRQNGTFDGTAISELLMKNKDEFPLESTNTSIRSGKQSGRTSVTSNIEREDASINSENEDKTEEKAEYSELEITEKFRNYLIYGDINGALAFASEHNLWGHAFFLASKVDRRQHAEIMLKFANKIKLNDPLQTLYQLMSGRIPASVTNVADEKWGDWRPHLAMLMSNSSEKPELIKKSITTLGDSLHNRGDLYGSQFCYLLSDVTFDRYTNVRQDSSFITASPNCARLILLGSNPQKSFKEFATNEAIMMTEIYEYARSLSENKYTIVELQHYKYLLATKMLDYGMQLKCLLYMEQIAGRIIDEPTKYDRDFIEKIFTLGDRLKYYDPVMEKALDESIDNMGRNNNYANVEDQKWLQNLSNILKSEQVDDASSDNQENATSHSNNDGYGMNIPNINEEIKYITDGINNLISQDNAEIFVNKQISQPEENYNLGAEQNNVNQVYDDQYLSYNQQINSYDQYSQYTEQPSYSDHSSNLQPIDENHQPDVQPATYPDWNYNNEMLKPSISMPHTKSNENAFSEDNKSDALKPSPLAEKKQQNTKTDKQPNQSSGWFGGIWNKLAKKNNQMILPDDKNPSIVWDDQKKKWVNKDGSGESETTESLKPPPKMMGLPKSIPLVQQAVGNTEAILQAPVVAHTSNIANIQRISNAPQPDMPSQHVSKSSDNVPTLQTNAYHRKRNQALKKSYVDVFNPSGAPTRNTDSIMAPTVPDMSIPQSGFFIPGQTNEQQSSQPFYDPTQY